MPNFEPLVAKPLNYFINAKNETNDYDVIIMIAINERHHENRTARALADAHGYNDRWRVCNWGLPEILTFLMCFGVLLSTRMLTAIDSPW